MKDCEAIMTFTSETLPVDHKAAIRQMKQELRQQIGDVPYSINSTRGLASASQRSTR
jgi:hypothetical protein